MHIVIANQWYPPESGWGGVAMYNHTIAQAYRALGHDVTIIARRNDAGTPADSETDGIRIHRLLTKDRYYLRRTPGVGYYSRPIQQLAYSRRVHQQLRRVHESKPIDVVEFAEINAEGYFFARQPFAPFVVRCHTPTFVLKSSAGHEASGFDTTIISACEKRMIRFAHGLTAPSRDMARRIAEATGIVQAQITVIPNPFDASTVNGNGNGHGVRSSSDSTVLYLGRIEAAKGIVTLTEAIPNVLKAAPKARFLIAGYDRSTSRGTSQRAEIEEALNGSGARANVEFLGAVEQTHLRGLYARADVCVVPALQYESFSYTCAQAMAAGKPVIATRIGGMSETVDHGLTGLIIDPGDAKQLASSIVELLSDQDARERMGRAGHDKVLREFDPQNVARQNLEVYERAQRAFASKTH